MLATAIRCLDPLEAHIIRGRLEAEGIRAFVCHEHHIWANWFLSTALGGVKVQVSPSEKDGADDILREIQTGEYQEILLEHYAFSEAEKCPKCESTNIYGVVWSQSLALVIIWLTYIPLPYVLGKVQCNDCGFTRIMHSRRAYPNFIKIVSILVLGIAFLSVVEFYYLLCKIHYWNPDCRL